MLERVPLMFRKGEMRCLPCPTLYWTITIAHLIIIFLQSGKQGASGLNLMERKGK